MTIRLALLGDSIAYGVGATMHAHTLAPRLENGLAARALAVETTVFAVPGARSRDLAGQVRRATTWGPDVAVIVIGSNDLSHHVAPAQAALDLRSAVRTLRERDVEVVVAPAPDLSIVPHVPAAMRPVVRAASRALRTAQVGAARDEGGLIADADDRTSPAFAADPSLFSPDRFHPSSTGYAVIAEALLPVVVEAAEVVTSVRADERSA